MSFDETVDWDTPMDEAIYEEGRAEDNQRLWELYVVDCENRGLTPSLQDFIIWREEVEDE